MEKVIAERLANMMTKDGEVFGVTESYEGGFELSHNGEAYAGGSYDIVDNFIKLVSAGPNNRIVAEIVKEGNYFLLEPIEADESTYNFWM